MTNSPWSGMVPVDDTALAVTDTGGTGTPVVYLNGAYASQRHWKPTIAELGGGDYRHITFDERARGKSQRSVDYSFEACLRDLDVVLKARRVEKPILVGWSYGAFIAMYWAERHPGHALGVVNVDGALPAGLTGEEGRERIRKLFRRNRLLLPLVAPFGLAARMSADQHAEVNIELNELAAACAPVLERVTCPVRYVLATGDSYGSKDGEQDGARAALEPVVAANPNLKVGARVASNHGSIMRKDYRAIAQAIREVASASAPAGLPMRD
ncbi:alpha/beta fold hydrolase [Streptomyces sp. TRM64462]|uniref:alpha/beta fold hydrolase n=1 Tax=Streptomyces sp. TRM64462 TaxID=2741726 RepID=UPI001586E672|nr:alpha/beta hydrolase [Streptomyces sp. TRM64462]